MLEEIRLNVNRKQQDCFLLTLDLVFFKHSGCLQFSCIHYKLACPVKAMLCPGKQLNINVSGGRGDNVSLYSQFLYPQGLSHSWTQRVPVHHSLLTLLIVQCFHCWIVH